MEAQLQNMWLNLEHEIFRKQNWEQLKHFRSKYDNEYQQSESILDNIEIGSKKKAMDKICVSAIRFCIHNEQVEKVFGYLDMIFFTQSLKVANKLAEQMKNSDLAQKISKFIQDKETKEVFLGQLPSDK